MSAQGILRRYSLIIERVHGNRFPSDKELLDHLEFHGFDISKRTLVRDLAAIRLEFALEIVWSPDRRGYYIDESQSIDLENFLRFLEIVNTADLLTSSLKESKDSLDYISFDKGGGLHGIELLKPLLEATKQHKKITFKHLNYQTGKTHTFTLSPYLLKEYQNRWYVVGLVSGMKDLRTFGVDRIQNLEIRKDTFVPDKKYDPKRKFKETIGLVYSLYTKQRIILSFTPAQGHYVKSLPLHSTQRVLIDDDKEFRIELNIIPNYEFIQLILMNNDKVRIIEPQWLIDEVISLLKNTLDRYK